jgi:hypothetical protein
MSTDRLSHINVMRGPVANLPATYPELGNTSDPADRIKRATKVDGFVVLCTYHSEENWQVCTQRIHQNLVQTMITSTGQDLLDKRFFELKAMDDENKYDGATTSTIQQYFCDWCSRAVNEEQGPSDKIESRRQEPVT